MELKQNNEHCCMDKKRLTNNETWFKTIKINPEFVIFNKFKRCKTYTKSVEITNEDIKPRLFNVKFDFQPESDFLNIKDISKQYILPQMSFKIEIYFEPISITAKRYKNNQRFNIFLEMLHPNAILEIPIMVIANPVFEPSTPIHINMPSTSPDISSIYALKICNLMKFQCDIDIRTNNKQKFERLKFYPKRLNIPSMEYGIIFIETKSEDFCEIFEELYFSSLKIKWKHLLTVKGDIIPYNLYFEKNLNFENTLIGCYTRKQIQVCNESKSSIKFKWCKNSTKAESCLNKNLFLQQEELKNVKKIDDVFIITPKSGILESVSSIIIKIYFCPIANDNSDIEKITNQIYPFQYYTNAYLADSSNPLNRQQLTLTGLQIGPKFTIDNTTINLNDIFIGQMQCLRIHVRNEDIVAGDVYFDYLETVNSAAELCCFPKSLRLKPGEYKYFDAEFYVTNVGCFNEIAYFKVKWGEKIKVQINGISKTLNLIVYPEKLNFDIVPLCITHTQTINVTNPLSLPITVVCNIEKDGEEEPFTLDNLLDVIIDPDNIVFEYNDNQDLIDKSQFFESLTTFTRKSKVFEIIDQLSSSSNSEISEKNLTEQLTSILLPRCDESVTNDELSTENDDINTETISVRKRIAKGLSIEFIKNAKQLFKNDITDNRLMTMLIENLMKEDYFSKLCNQESIIQNNWDLLPSDPREYDVDKKIFFLEPHETTTITISLICNTVGPITHTLLLKIVDINPDKSFLMTSSSLNTILTMSNYNRNHLKASNTITKIKLKHKGVIPKICIHDYDILDNIEVYVELPYEFNFDVVTDSDVPGFFYFKLFPRSFNAEMSIYPRISYISNSKPLKIYAKLIAYETGEIILLGSYAVVGSIIPQKLKIMCRSKPPELKIHQKKICTKQKVLEIVEHRIFIENKCPTKARIFASVDFEDAEIEPKGCILGPHQIVLFLLKTKFKDSLTYKFNVNFNAIYVGILKVPVVINVEGIPITIVSGVENSILDFGTLQIGLKALYEKQIIFMNHGKNAYKVSISKRNHMMKTNHNNNDNNEVKCDLKPMKFILESGESKIITVSVHQCSRSYKFSNEFIVEGSSKQNFHKYNIFNLICKGEFVKCNINWNVSQIVFELKKCDSERSDDYADDTKTNSNAISKKATLRNNSPINLNVKLIVIGQFFLYDECKRKATKNYEFQMKPKEHKIFEIFFDRSSIKSSQFETYTGEIITTTEYIKQIKPVLLYAQISSPTVQFLCQNDYTFFMKNSVQFFASIIFRNPSDCQLFYTISSTKENICPINVNYNKNSITEQKIIFEKLKENFYPNLFTNFIDVDNEFRKSLERFVFEEESSDEERVPENIVQIDENISFKQNTDRIDLKKTKIKKKKISKKSPNPNSATTRNKKKSRTANDDENNKKNFDQTDRNGSVPTDDISKQQKFEKDGVADDTSQIINEKLFTDELDETVKKSIPFEDVVDRIRRFLNNKDKSKKRDNFLDKYFSIKNFDESVNDENTNKTIKKNYLCLSNYEGFFKPKECKTLHLLCEKLSKNTVLNKKFVIEIPKGISKNFEISVYNYETKVEISQTDFDFGVQPWYKLISQNIKISNTDERNFKIGIIENLYLMEYNWKLMGLVALQKSLGSNCIYLKSGEQFDINAIVYLGFNNCFKNGFGIEVNNNIANPITFKGQSTIPMALILNCSRPNLKLSSSKCEIYKILNKIYKDIIENVIVSSADVKPTQDEINDFRMFLSNYNDAVTKTVKDESKLSIFDYKQQNEKNYNNFTASLIALPPSSIIRGKDLKPHNLKISSDDCSISIMYEIENSSLTYKNNILHLDDDLKEFEILDYPNSYPCQIHLEKLIDIEKFLLNMKKSPEIKENFKKIFNKYISNAFKNQEFKQTEKYVPNVPPKKFIIRPIPYNVETYMISNKDIFWLDEQNEINIEMVFCGPGRGIFAARNTASLPGFMFIFMEPVKNLVLNENNLGKTVLPKFLIYQYDTQKDPITGKYKNYTERFTKMNREKFLDDAACMDCDRSICDEDKICHPHSYDLQSDIFIHSRKIMDPNEKKILYKHYSRLSQPNNEDKNPNILCELYQVNSVCCDNTIFPIKIFFKPLSNFYQDQMIFEEYLYIDIHLGITIPILIKGKFCKR